MTTPRRQAPPASARRTSTTPSRETRSKPPHRYFSWPPPSVRPLRIQLGSDSFAAIAGKLEFVAAEQEAWRDLALLIDFEDAAAG
jgi:hypothetical protein